MYSVALCTNRAFHNCTQRGGRIQNIKTVYTPFIPVGIREHLIAQLRAA